MLRVTVAGFLAFAVSIGKAGAQTQPASPGTLIDIGGHRLHLYCTGRGTPTVVLEAGLGAYSMDWALVQPPLSSVTRVCAYDRAGYAWSDLGPEPRGLHTSVRELHSLLTKAAIPAPYILVGQSWGGRIVRLYAHLYPQDVAGLVLVDTYTEDSVAVGASVLTSLDAREQEEQDPTTRLPLPVQQQRAWARGLPRQGDISDPDEPDAAIAATTATDKAPLGDRPLIVVSAGRLSWEAEDRASGHAYMDELRSHIRGEAYLATLSHNSRFVVGYESFHQVQLYQPDLVAQAIRAVLTAVRTHAPVAIPATQ